MKQATVTRSKTRKRLVSAGPILLSDATGYELDGRSVHGFADRTDVPAVVRTTIARFAREYAPEKLSVEQRALLEKFDAAPAPEASELLRALTHDLADEESGRFMALLPKREREWVRNPSTKLAGATYPLTISQLAALSGVTEKQLRHWTTNSLMVDHRVAGQRVFLRSAVVRALTLRESSPQQIGVLKTIAKGGQMSVRLTRLFGLVVSDLAHRVGSRDIVQAADTLVDRAEEVGQHAHV